MSGFELNKIAAAILLSCLIAMIVGTVANVIYKPNLKPQQRGYSVQTTEDSGVPGQATAEETPVDIPTLMKTANAEAGKKIISKCISCHSFDKDGPNKVGPKLWNIVGREKAKVDGFKYSSALIAKGGSWDEESLFHFLTKPAKFIPGTKMTFVGISNPQEVADVIAFLKAVEHD